MSKAMQLVGIILLGIFTLVIINLMNDVRSTNELDYYLLQETVEASMYDAIDYSYYRETGLIKVDRDMFLESFNRRFAESVDSSNLREYKIKIIDFNETPPKASVEVTTVTAASVKGEGVSVVNRVDGIIETIYDDYVYSRGFYQMLVNPIAATPVTDDYAAASNTIVYDATGGYETYNATKTTKTYDERRGEACRHCHDKGSYQGPLYCAQHGIPTDDSCGSCTGPGGICSEDVYTCNSGDTLDNNSKICTHNTLACPSGGTLDYNTKKCTRIVYSCPNGGTLNSQNVCKKVVYTCPAGTVLKEGNVCVTTYDPR